VDLVMKDGQVFARDGRPVARPTPTVP